MRHDMQQLVYIVMIVIDDISMYVTPTDSMNHTITDETAVLGFYFNGEFKVSVLGDSTEEKVSVKLAPVFDLNVAVWPMIN